MIRPARSDKHYAHFSGRNARGGFSHKICEGVSAASEAKVFAPAPSRSALLLSMLKDKGLRVTLIRPAEINALAREYLAQHGERLINEAEHVIATSPYFVKWRKPEEMPFMEK